MLNIAQTGVMMGNANQFDPVTTWIERGTALGYTLPSTTVQDALRVFMGSLNGAGLFTRMKTGYILHAGSAQMGTLNIRNPLTYQTSLTNSPSFSEGNGIRSNGTSSYINQPFTGNEYSGIQSDVTAIQYISESSTSFGVLASHGCTTASGRFWILYPYQTATLGKAFNWQPSSTDFSSTNHKGLVVHRNNGTLTIAWKDGTKTIGAMTPSAPTIAQNRLILAVNVNAGSGVTPTQYYPRYVALDFLFDGFSDTDESNFRTAFNTYKTAVGLP